MSKLVKGIMGLSAALICQTAGANSFTCFLKQCGSFYVSADAGVFRGNIDAKYNDVTDVISQNIAESVQQNGYVAGVAVGYTLRFNDFYSLGAELSGHMATRNARFQAGASTAGFTDKTEIENYFDLMLVPGIQLVDTVTAYGKLGLSLANLSDRLTSPVGFTPTYVSYHANKTALGLAAGLGLKKKLTPHVSLFTEYTYHDYGKVSFGGFQNFSASYGHSAMVTSSAVTLGVLYSF